MDEFTLIQKIIIWAIPVIFAITVHEVAHGWVALQFGDRTAQMLGRLTLNPIKHIDPIGTVILPSLLLITGVGFIFGWAKPVPVTYQNLRRPKTDMAWVALAGPMANLLMAIIWAILAKVALMLLQSNVGMGEPLLYMSVAGILINAMLMMLNLLPLPPLDGGRILVGVLPGPLGWKVSQIEPYGFLIIIALAYFGMLYWILWPLIGGFIRLIAILFALPPQIFSIL